MARFRRADLTARDFDITAYHPLGTAKMGPDGRSSVIGPDDLGLTSDVLPSIMTLADAKEKFQRDYINEVLALNNGNRTKTARDLCVDPRTIFRHLEKENDDGTVEPAE